VPRAPRIVDPTLVGMLGRSVCSYSAGLSLFEVDVGLWIDSKLDNWTHQHSTASLNISAQIFCYLLFILSKTSSIWTWCGTVDWF